MNDFLDAAQILAAEDLVLKRVPVPEWGGTIFVRSLNGEQRDAFERDVKQAGDDNLAKMLVVVRHVACDQAGRALFAIDDVAALKAKNCAVILRVAIAGLAHNAMTEDEVAALKND